MAVAVAVIGGLQLFLARTQWGRAFRATSDDQRAAQLMGINNQRLYGFAMALALVTAGIAGVFIGIRTTFTPDAGQPAAHLRLRGRDHRGVSGRCGARWPAASCSASRRPSVLRSIPVSGCSRGTWCSSRSWRCVRRGSSRSRWTNERPAFPRGRSRPEPTGSLSPSPGWSCWASPRCRCGLNRAPAHVDRPICASWPSPRCGTCWRATPACCRSASRHTSDWAPTGSGCSPTDSGSTPSWRCRWQAWPPR